MLPFFCSDTCLPLWELSSKWNLVKSSNVRISVFAKIKRQVQLRIKKSKFKNQKKSNHFLQKSRKNQKNQKTHQNQQTKRWIVSFKSTCGQAFMSCLKIAFRETLCAVALAPKKEVLCIFEVKANSLEKATKKTTEKKSYFQMI